MFKKNLLAFAVSIVTAFAAVISPQLTAEPLKGDAELGFVSTSGNSESETINAKLTLTKEDEDWAHEAKFAALSNSQEDQDTGVESTTAEKYTANLQSNRKLDERSFFYALASYVDDRFSGFNYQATVGVGYGYKVIMEEDKTLTLEIGPGYRVNDVMGESDEKEVTLRLGEKFNWAFSSNASFDQFLIVEGGKDNTISRLGLSLTAALAGPLSLKLSTEYKYTEEVPEDREHADTETSATIVYSF